MASEAPRSLWRLNRVAALLVSLAVGAPAQAQEGELTGDTTVYVRTDTDQTTVVTPSMHVGAALSERTRVDGTYLVDVWTSASVDIRTAATPRVTEQRDEFDGSIDHDFGDLSMGASYRYSLEYDYESHGGSLGASLDLAENNTTLALVASASFDQVWAAGASDFKQPANNFSGRFTYTQVFDPNMFGQLIYELAAQDGFLSSPYRFVRVADAGGNLPATCAYPVGRCLPENNPSSRLRNAVALLIQRAMGDTTTLGGSYRFYLDDWGINSHTIELNGTLRPSDNWLLELSYRFYIQGGANHYQPYYEYMSLPAVYTSDKELSALSSHRLAFVGTRWWELGDSGRSLKAVMLVGPTFYRYPDVPLLDQVTAFEATLSVGVEL